MGSNSSSTNLFDSLHQWCRAEHGALSSNKLYERPYRMEASFYTSDGYASLNAMRNSGFNLHKIGEIATVFWFGPFARRYVSDPVYGIPFLSSSNMMEARPKSYNLISKKHTKNLQKYIVHDGYILVSCSGTIGNIALVTKDMDGWAVSQHAIRVIVRDAIDLGTVYCFLQSSLGQFLIQRSMSGSVVQSIYEADVSNLPIPRLPRRLREELTKQINEVSNLRVEANRLFDKAEMMICKQLSFSKEDFYSGKDFQINTVKSCQLIATGEYKGNLRLDAHPFNKIANIIRDKLKKHYCQSLHRLVNEVIYIGKVYRIPIEDPDRSKHLLSGKDIVMLRPSEDKLLSVLNDKHIKKCLLHREWILVTRSGTLGRTCMVHKNYEGYIGSEDILRIIPNEKTLDPYYLSAFLYSEIGQIIIGSLTYGSVILHLSKEQLESIPIPIPQDLGVSIGSVVKNAYDKRADALEKENAAFDLFMTAIREGREATEAEWGSEE